MAPPRQIANPVGWDSAFEYEGKTYAEMSKVEKNKVSHRGKALAKLSEWLKDRTSPL
jgi:inosine triphosphate pyrophosphatase